MKTHQSEHFVRHLKGAPENIYLHHFFEDGEPMSAIYEGDKCLSVIDRCAEYEIINHWFKNYRARRK